MPLNPISPIACSITSIAAGTSWSGIEASPMNRSGWARIISESSSLHSSAIVRATSGGRSYLKKPVLIVRTCTSTPMRSISSIRSSAGIENLGMCSSPTSASSVCHSPRSSIARTNRRGVTWLWMSMTAMAQNVNWTRAVISFWVTDATRSDAAFITGWAK